MSVLLRQGNFATVRCKIGKSGQLAAGFFILPRFRGENLPMSQWR
jgi:hypothetical protein